MKPSVSGQKYSPREYGFRGFDYMEKEKVAFLILNFVLTASSTAGSTASSTAGSTAGSTACSTACSTAGSTAAADFFSSPKYTSLTVLWIIL